MPICDDLPQLLWGQITTGNHFADVHKMVRHAARYSNILKNIGI